MSYKDVDRTVVLCCLDNCDKWVYNSSDQCVHLWPYCTTQTGHTFTPNLFYQITCPCPLIKILASTKVWVWEERVTRETNVTEETTVWQGGLLCDIGDNSLTRGEYYVICKNINDIEDYWVRLLCDKGDYCVVCNRGNTVWQKWLLYDKADYCMTWEATVWQGGLLFSLYSFILVWIRNKHFLLV